MAGYYDEKLAADRLRQAYACAPPRIKQYLQAEIDYVSGFIHPHDTVLELGCGYGRVLRPLAEKAGYLLGIDTSRASLDLARQNVPPRVGLVQTDASQLSLRDNSFDLVVCIQNGISAFHVDPATLFRESIRVTKKNGKILFSSYTESFWPERIVWFKTQAKLGLLGEIDFEKSTEGRIVCKDGFTARTFNPEQFTQILSGFEYPFTIREIDNSSVFCEITVR
ncbi:MAG: class I SAM-dependent methyltransferase [Candidatus Zixiibacteriota bacterium]